ncbi:MAG: monooxygenase, partial [Actinomycetota bacterium]
QGANLISNVTHNLVESATTIALVVRHALDVGAEEVEVTADAEREWVRGIEQNPTTFTGNAECTPGYYNNEGQPISESDMFNGSGHPGGPVAFFEFLDAWRQTGAFAGLSFS